MMTFSTDLWSVTGMFGCRLWLLGWSAARVTEHNVIGTLVHVVVAVCEWLFQEMHA